MPSEDSTTKRQQLEQAIAVQESLRGTLGDEIVDVTIEALRKQLAELEEPSEAEHQRKLMTVLFMDVVGSTQLLRELDPEEGLALMDSALKRLAVPVENHGGRILRFMGDGLLAVFGLPSARENDPEMAVRAGLEILNTAEIIAKDLEVEKNIGDFLVRVGVNTGLVVSGGVTEGENTIMGSAVNLAARLENAAPPGGMLISNHTYQHVRGLFEVELGDSIQIKGFADPVQVYQVKRAMPRAFRLTTRGVEGVETSMVGREEELDLLKDMLRAVSEGHVGRFVTVVGEAGLGKSRLLAEFEGWLGQGSTLVDLLKGRATLESQDLPYALLRDLVSRWLGISDDDSISEVREKILGGFKAAPGQGAHLERDASFVGQWLGYDFRDSPHLRGVLEDPQQIHDRALVYLTDYFRALSEERPLVIFLDDIHWSDPSSLDVIQLLFDNLFNQRILIIALTRPLLFERRSNWGDGEGQLKLDLQPLSPQESAHLVEEVLKKVRDLPDALRNLIIENAEGIPFYLEELVKMLVEDGVVVKNDPEWYIRTERLGKLRIPSTLTGVLQARIDSLPVKERQVLQQASVIGRIFWDEAICYLNQDQAPGQAIAPMVWAQTKLSLEDLESREMIFEQPGSVFSEAAEYYFKNAILQEVTYEIVLKRLRQGYHAKVADWLITRSTDRAEEFAGLIAGHLEKAGKKEQAAEYLSQAAKTAVSNFALDEAKDFYTRALEQIPETDLERRYELILGRMRVFHSQGDRAAERKDLEDLSSIAGILADEHKQIEVSTGWAWLAYFLGDFTEAKAAAERGLSLADSTHGYETIGETLNVLAFAEWQLREYDDALAKANTALNLADQADDRRFQGRTLMTLGVIHSSLGDYSAARGAFERALSIARELGDLHREHTVLSNLGVTLTMLGDYKTARGNFQYGLENSHEMGNQVYAGVDLINLGWVCAAEGEWESARDHLVAGLEILRKAEHFEGIAEGLIWLGHACLGSGQPERANDAYQESLELRRTLNQTDLAMEALAGLARTALAQGDLSKASDQVGEIMTYLGNAGTLEGTWEPLRIYLTCIQVLEQVGDYRAEKLLEEAYQFLLQRAALISAEDDRRSYLENVPWNRKINQLWAAQKGEQE
jgi:class 3 adenylate cyclase/tetratricopeptide (TPR) repeat protein